MHMLRVRAESGRLRAEHLLTAQQRSAIACNAGVQASRTPSDLSLAG